MISCETALERLFTPGTPADAEVEEHLASCSSCAQAQAADGAILAALAPGPMPEVPEFEAILAPSAETHGRRVRQRAVRRRLVPFAFAAGVAALLAAAAALVATRDRTPAFVANDTLSAAEAPRTAILPSGARLELASGRVTLAVAKPGAERLRLDAGRVSLAVPKLGPDGSLGVETPDALVLVHGTRFAVVSGASGTDVAVTEGIVEVRSAARAPAFLHAGDALHVEPRAAVLARLHGAATAALEANDLPGARAQLESLLAAEPPVALAAEARAMLAWVHRSEGDRDGARALYRRALAELPADDRSAWAEDACAELALLEEQLGSSRAAWRECLRRFPNGAHADLARQHLGDAP